MATESFFKERIAEKSKERHRRFYDWLRTVVTTAIGLVGIIIAFKTDRSETWTEYYLYLSTCTLLVLGILTGVVGLYGEVQAEKDFESRYLELLIQSRTQALPREDTVVVTANRFFSASTKASYGLLCAGLISLLVYAGYSDQPKEPVAIPEKGKIQAAPKLILPDTSVSAPPTARPTEKEDARGANNGLPPAPQHKADTLAGGKP